MRRLLWLVIPALMLVACDMEPKTIGELEKAGKEAFLKEDYAKARDYLGKAVTLKSSDRDILYFLGLSYKRDYMMDSALFYLKRTDILHPNDREVNLSIYPIAAELKEWELAARAVNVMIATGDPIEKYRERLADLNVKMENYFVAFLHARALLEMEPENPGRYYQLSLISFKLDSLNYSLDIIEQAMDKFGENPRFLSQKGLILSEKKEYAAAERIFRPLLAADSSAMTKWNLAGALANQDKRSKKQEAYELYQQVKDILGPQFQIDSSLSVLEQELN